MKLLHNIKRPVDIYKARMLCSNGTYDMYNHIGEIFTIMPSHIDVNLKSEKYVDKSLELVLVKVMGQRHAPNCLFRDRNKTIMGHSGETGNPMRIDHWWIDFTDLNGCVGD